MTCKKGPNKAANAAIRNWEAREYKLFSQIEWHFSFAACDRSLLKLAAATEVQ